MLGHLKIHLLAKEPQNLSLDRCSLGCKDSTAGGRARVWWGAQTRVPRHHISDRKYSLRACRAAEEGIHLFTANVSIETPSPGLKMWIPAAVEGAFCPPAHLREQPHQFSQQNCLAQNNSDYCIPLCS